MMFSKDFLGSYEWYDALAYAWLSPSKTTAMQSLIDTLIRYLKIDSALVMHFPKDEGPYLLFNKMDSKKRSNSIDDYMKCNYIIDPFYINMKICRDRYVLSLREVIEENFSQSEYYMVHYESAGLIDELCFCGDDRQNGYVVLSLSRAEGHQPFDEEEIEATRAIAPLIVGALSASWQDLGVATGSDMELSKITTDLHRHLENARLNFGKSLLTKREFDVLQRILIGNSIELISIKMKISVETVKVHRKHIYRKLNIKSQSEVFSLFIDAASSVLCENGCDPLFEYMKKRRIS